MKLLMNPISCLICSASLVAALVLNPSDPASVSNAASTVAYGMMKYYTGNNTGDVPGNLPAPYYWWEAGGMFGHVVEYWYYTGDATYNNETVQAIAWQAGTDGAFMPANQTSDEGNDDQAFWALTAMAAAELNFPAPPEGYPSWLAMAQAVFNIEAGRWDSTTCGGGLRWQLSTLSSGYNYKNPAANGAFFQLATRLARYTGNATYVDWAETAWDWFSTSQLWNNATAQVYDGTSTTNNCSDADNTQWTYNYGLYVGGLAYIYNHTEDTKWLGPLQRTLNTTISTFFARSANDKIVVEIACEPSNNCDTDMLTFKSYTMRWLAVTAQLVPPLSGTIWPFIQASSTGAAGQCNGGTDGVTCGFDWTTSVWDGTYGVGQQMSALAAISANMINTKTLKPPYTSTTGGTSKGDPNAGSNANTHPGESEVYREIISTSDRAGAGILTALALLLMLIGAYWIVV